MGDGLEIRDTVIMGNVSANLDPVRVECPSCMKSGLLTLHPCENPISDECFEKICDTCFGVNSVCKPCLEEIDNREFQKRKSELSDKIDKNQTLIQKFKQNLWDNKIISYCTKIGLILIVVGGVNKSVSGFENISLFFVMFGSCLIMPWVYGGIAYLWILGKRDLLVIQLDELENK